MQLVSFWQPHTTITQISLQPTRVTQDHTTWQRRTEQLIVNQNAPIAIPSGTPDTRTWIPTPSRSPVTKELQQTGKQLNTPKLLPLQPMSYEDLPAKCLIRRTTINPRMMNRLHHAQDTSWLKAHVYLLDPTADATCPLWMKKEQAVEDYEDTSTLHYLQQRTFGCPSTPLSYLARATSSQRCAQALITCVPNYQNCTQTVLESDSFRHSRFYP